MAGLTPCEPCDCISGNMSTPVFYQNALITLCEILAAISGGSFGAHAVLPQVTKQYTQITNAFVSLGLLDGTFKLNRLYINNQTTSMIEVSMDGGVTVAFNVTADNTLHREFPGWTGAAATSVQIRYAGTAPTEGTAYFDGSY